MPCKSNERATMVTNHDHIILISMILGGIPAWFHGYWHGLDIGKVRGRIEYRKLERAKREG